MNSIYFDVQAKKVFSAAIFMVVCSSFLFAQVFTIEKEVSEAPKTGEQIGLFSLDESDHEPKAFLGVMLRESTDEDGLEIVEYTGESAVEKAGIPVGARLLTLDMKPLTSIEGLLELLSDKNPGDKVSMRYSFDEEAKSVDVILGERPRKKTVEKVIIRKGKSEKGDWGSRSNTYAPGMKRVIIREAPRGESNVRRYRNDLNLESITIEKGFQEGDLHLKFSGVTGKVDVVLRKERAQVVERIVYENLQGEFEHHFTLGSGAQGVYYLQIKHDDKTYAERIYF
jgi:hypothetical protein